MHYIEYILYTYIINFVYFTLDIAALKHEIDFLYIPLCIKTINVLYFDRRHAKESKKIDKSSAATNHLSNDCEVTWIALTLN